MKPANPGPVHETVPKPVDWKLKVLFFPKFRVHVVDNPNPHTYR